LSQACRQPALIQFNSMRRLPDRATGSWNSSGASLAITQVV
jgi:hypothetical protein